MITTNADEFIRQSRLSGYHPVRLGEFDADYKIKQTMSVNPPDKLTPMTPSRWPELMSISTLSEYLDMSSASIRSLITQGVLPDATAAPTPRLKRWKRSVVDDALQRIADRKTSLGVSMADALMSQHSRNKGGR